MLSAFNTNATDRLPKPTHLNEQKGFGNITPHSTVHPRCLRRASFKERRGGRINERELGSLFYSEKECTLTYYELVIKSTTLPFSWSSAFLCGGTSASSITGRVPSYLNDVVTPTVDALAFAPKKLGVRKPW
jgi:hypothetical protein